MADLKFIKTLYEEITMKNVLLRAGKETTTTKQQKHLHVVSISNKHQTTPYLITDNAKP